MPKLPIEAIEPGMALAEDLTTSEGRMLLPRGAVVTEAHLRTCRVWGISEVSIQGDDAACDDCPTSFDELDPEVLDACKIMAAQRFVLNPLKHPVVQEMAKVYVLRQARDLDVEQANWMLAANPHDDTFNLTTPPPTREESFKLNDVVTQEAALASLPNIFFEISEALKNPRSSAAYVAEVISKDVALSAKLLKMVNSPFYGFSSKIDTLSRAVTIVGTNQLTNLALGVSVIAAFDDIPEEFFTLKEFWLHSVTCGIVARLLASKAGLQGDEKFFVAGLLHDIGRLIMLKNHPQASTDVLRPAKVGRRALVDVERTVWGCTHADIGGKLLKMWRLPAFLEVLIHHHHNPLQASMPAEASVIHLADFITHGLGIGASGASLVPEFDPRTWEMLKLDKDDLFMICRQAERQARDVMAAFFPGD
ncbi:HDOD domain-containing protein [Pseudodesulfovibrio sp. zrk46]|uniref:HDOD domain-containing protein n=1 Tax=Pseudodesulfovibrio sp. zrk46 TaxID=2725288 RepID=UPI001449CD3F|nr:HDOD domain-containing protein [Pseudodesulfovibrio sp. zrk46]QJB55784.1 HDOD domain-containing protein [Pseudodesulfovibrio sp. zrk46]